ncbi:hypothetical protein E6W39_17790 [Kitasatospora acidiphila]|uniref:Uncharacterized protein n=1 Tax=Kitasatospora acidiphila TaxID=2567942 RepID=A0A540W4A6_9ACTN|nr:hypothetical protein [Kitasatospora acidiphila]TQF03747.1 hypothetical protein E6W39_17790 [Kitasatospora acidiphila]
MPATGRPAHPARAMPPNHQALTARYGAGVFDEFIVLYAPNWSPEYLDLGHRAAESAAGLAGSELPGLRELLTAYGSRPEELIHWAHTHNADRFFWIPTGTPDQWPTVLVAAGQLDQELLPGDSTSILLGLLTGSIRSRILPDDLPSDEPQFEPLP